MNTRSGRLLTNSKTIIMSGFLRQVGPLREMGDTLMITKLQPVSGQIS